MRKCKRYRINLDETFEDNCPKCIFNNIKENKCNYDIWTPGLKNGKDLTKEN